MVCLGYPEWRYTDLPGGGRGHLMPRMGRKYPTMSWEAMLASVGLPEGRAPSFLKIDCEGWGCELDLFRSLIDAGKQHLLPDQITAELHYPYDPNSRSVWNKRFHDLGKTYPVTQMAGEMHFRAGFTIVGHVHNEAAQCCQEVLFARTECAANSLGPSSAATGKSVILQTRPTDRIPDPSPLAVRTCPDGSPWQQTEAVLKASLLPVEDQLLHDWIAGYLQNAPCFPRLHVITGNPQAAAAIFHIVPNVTHHANNFPPVVGQASTYLQMQCSGT